MGEELASPRQTGCLASRDFSAVSARIALSLAQCVFARPWRMAYM